MQMLCFLFADEYYYFTYDTNSISKTRDSVCNANSTHYENE